MPFQYSQDGTGSPILNISLHIISLAMCTFAIYLDCRDPFDLGNTYMYASRVFCYSLLRLRTKDPRIDSHYCVCAKTKMEISMCIRSLNTKLPQTGAGTKFCGNFA